MSDTLSLFSPETLEQTAKRQDVSLCVVRYNRELAKQLIATNSLTVRQYRLWKKRNLLPEYICVQVFRNL